MKIQNLNYEGFLSNSYLVSIQDNKHYLIDPSVNLSVLKKFVNKLDGILITHAHVDHIINLKDIHDYYHAKVYCHKNAIEKIEDNKKNCGVVFGLEKNLKLDSYEIIHEGDKIDGLFKVMETPGHTDCSVCYLLEEDNEHVMFSGDTLFKNGVGRTDLYSGNMADLMKSIKRIQNLKLDYKIYPGHEDYTTLNEEKVTNEYMLR